MPTRSFESSIDIDPQIFNMLNKIALAEHKTISIIAKELIIEALEDKYFSEIAETRDKSYK